MINWGGVYLRRIYASPYFLTNSSQTTLKAFTAEMHHASEWSKTYSLNVVDRWSDLSVPWGVVKYDESRLPRDRNTRTLCDSIFDVWKVYSDVVIRPRRQLHVEFAAANVICVTNRWLNDKITFIHKNTNDKTGCIQLHAIDKYMFIIGCIVLSYGNDCEDIDKLSHWVPSWSWRVTYTKSTRHAIKTAGQTISQNLSGSCSQWGSWV